jgi:hypothetical protein
LSCSNQDYNIKANYLRSTISENGDYIYFKPTQYECFNRAEEKACDLEYNECPVFEKEKS